MHATISIFVKVHDAEALMAAARRRYCQENPSESMEQAEAVVAAGDVSSALRMLFDPGISPHGCTIIDSECELFQRD